MMLLLCYFVWWRRGEEPLDCSNYLPMLLSELDKTDTVGTIFKIWIWFLIGLLLLQIREEPPSYSTSVLQRKESFENPLAGRGGRSFGSHEDEDKSSGNPQSGKALYDFTAGGGDEVSSILLCSELDGLLVVLKSFLCYVALRIIFGVFGYTVTQS